MITKSLTWLHHKPMSPRSENHVLDGPGSPWRTTGLPILFIESDVTDQGFGSPGLPSRTLILPLLPPLLLLHTWYDLWKFSPQSSALSICSYQCPPYVVPPAHFLLCYFSALWIWKHITMLIKIKWNEMVKGLRRMSEDLNFSGVSDAVPAPAFQTLLKSKMYYSICRICGERKILSLLSSQFLPRPLFLSPPRKAMNPAYQWLSHYGLRTLLPKNLDRTVSNFGVFWFLEYLHRLYQLSTPNAKTQNPKCSKIQHFLSIVSLGMLSLCSSDLQPSPCATAKGHAPAGQEGVQSAHFTLHPSAPWEP